MATWKAGPKREDARSMEAYRRYKDQGPGRSLARLAAELQLAYGLKAPKLPTLEKWSAALHWQERLRQDEIKAEQDADRELVLQLMTRRRRLITKRLDTLEVQLVGGFKALTDTVPNGQAIPKDQSKMDPRVLHAVTTSIARAVQGLRLEFGLPTDKLDLTVQDDAGYSSGDQAVPADLVDVSRLTQLYAALEQADAVLAAEEIAASGMLDQDAFSPNQPDQHQLPAPSVIEGDYSHP